MSAPPSKKTGLVYLVGAGPGDPGLLTLRGAECLRKADVVLYDYLVNPHILTHAAESAELVCLGRHGTVHHGGDRLLSQVEINALMVEHALAGKTVVRLKGGDPAVFARAAEEIAALEAAGLRYEIVPGITAALAAASHAGIPVTHRKSASAVAIVTGQERAGKADSNLEFGPLAKFPGTLVFYMGVTTAREWTKALIEAGKPADTPAAIIRRCSWPDQQIVRCKLGDVAEQLAAHKIRPPVIVVVGPAVDEAPESNWFSQRPLFGKSVLVTRPIRQAGELATRLAELGANVLVQPVIEIGPPDDSGPLESSIQRLGDYDWVVFSSANGVRAIVERLLQSGRDARALAGARIAAIGPGTAEELAKFHLKADLIPETYRAEALAEALAPQAGGKRFLLVRASRGREVLAESLRAAGGQVEQVVAYSSRDVAAPAPEIQAAIDEGRIDWVTVTSSAIARSLAAMFPTGLPGCKLASISPLTSAALAERGLRATVEAREYTTAGLVEAILDYEAGH